MVAVDAGLGASPRRSLPMTRRPACARSPTRTGELRTLEAIERDLIQFAIDHYSGHMSEVARRLGIGRSTLYRKVREYDLKVRDGEDLDEVG